MSLEPGQSLSHYRLVKQIGEGGMGVVWKAEDLRLRRCVALKVLPPDLVADPERRKRLIREARAEAAVSHPNVAHVYEVDESGGLVYLAMEYVEGEPLRASLEQGPMPVSEALRVATEVAEGLAAAHSARIVHRDLKPENVMVRPDGHVKILDFGLAKVIEEREARSQLEQSRFQTLTDELTRAGNILGTTAYMSPEQTAGEPVDARSDIFSFGVMLYEMLTGTHPFRRGSMIDTLAAIRDPHPNPPSQVSPLLPPEADEAVLRCLRKAPEDRWQNVSDLGAVLQGIHERSTGARQTGRSARTGPLLLGVAAAVLIVLVAGAWLFFRRGTAREAPLQLSRVTYDGGISVFPSISADGKLIAYASDRAGNGQLDIWVKYISQTEPARLTSHPTDDWMASFSPDGSQLVFHSRRDGGGIYLIGTFGGEPRKIAGNGLFPRFSPDGSKIVFIEDSDWGNLRRMFLVSPDGGEPRPFLPEFGAISPPGSVGLVWSPDGHRLLFRGARLESPGEWDWWIAPVDGGEPTSTGIREAFPPIDVIQFPCVWLADRVLLTAGTTIEGMNIYSAHISPVGKISGPPRPLTTGPGMSWVPTVADDGRVALSRFQWRVNLWAVDLDPASGKALTKPSEIATTPAPKLSFSLSRDGSRLAYSTWSGTQDRRRAEVRVRELASGKETVPVFAPGDTASLEPRLSPDGSLLGWAEVVEGRLVSFVVAMGDPSGRRQLCDGCVVRGFLSDASQALVRQGRKRLSLVRLADGNQTTLVQLEEGAILDADLSWDNRWLALWTGRKDGRVAVHILPLRDGEVPREDWIEVFDGTPWVGEPHWSPDGRLLYHLSDRDDFTCVWALPLDPETKQPAGEPVAVAHAHRTSMNLNTPQRLYSLTVGRGRLVFNAGEVSGEVYTGMLGPS